MSNVPVYTEKPIALSFNKIIKIEKFVRENKKKFIFYITGIIINFFQVIQNFNKKEKFILRAFYSRKNKTNY